MDSLTTVLSRFLPKIFGFFVIYTFSRWIYRIYFSPLSHIPGPKLAAASRWYEFYYDGIRQGKFYVEIERMHKVYGPIVRINPYEVHIDDPSFFDELYNVSKRLDKDPWYYDWLDRAGSIFATMDHDHHKMRSSVIRRFFSTSSISKIEHVVADHVRVFCNRMSACKGTNKPIPMSDAFRSLAVDVVTDYSIPETYNLVELDDWGVAHATYIREVTALAMINRFFKWILPTMEKMPRALFEMQGSVALSIYDGLKHQRDQAAKVIANDGKAISSKQFPVIMNEVYKSDLPPEEKTQKRLYHEMAILIGAGSETTGTTLATVTYHLLASPNKLQRLKAELATIPAAERQDVISYKRLETLPYFTAVVNEGLRLAIGVCGRLPRINRHNVTKYKDYVLPPGTSISMSIRDMHYNPALFSEPLEFRPERWLGPEKVVAEKNFAPFNRGSRSCVGKNLAMAELQMTIANIFDKFEMEIFESSRKDIELVHDNFAPFPAKDSKGLQLLVL